MDLLIDSQYYPSIAYVSEIYRCEKLIINDLELFNKQSFRNRSIILGANGVLDLIVPVNHQSARKMNKLEVNTTERWATIHARSIESGYKRSPYYEYFSEALLQPLLAEKRTLLELNTAILTAILKILQIEKEIFYLSAINDYNKSNTKDLTGRIHPKKNEISIEYPVYQQVFEKNHFSNMSILDPIFCIGRETILLF